MSDPLWTAGDKKAERRARRLEVKKRRAQFVVEYNLAYEGGGGRWNGYYKTYWGARLAAFKEVHISSWGGSAELFPYPKPVPPPEKTKKRMKGLLFNGR